MSAPSNDRGPLAGIRVVDWTHVLAGPFAGYQLALLGAEVIRIERPSGDDMIRTTAADPALGAQGLGETFVTQGANKQSLAIDARDPRGKAALAALIADADVLLENFRPGKLAALGFDPERLIEQHPVLIVCSITGFGPASGRRAYDHIVQAASGLMRANADTSGRPQRVGFPLIDYAVGQQAAMAVLAALYRRDATQRSGERRDVGEWLQVSMSGAATSLMAPVYAERLVSGTERPRTSSTAFSGSPLSGTFEVADGWFALVCNARNQDAALMDALRESGVEEGALRQLAALSEADDVTGAQAVLGGLLRGRTAADWDERFARYGVPATPVRHAVEAAADAASSWPQVRIPVGTGGATRATPVPGIGFTSSRLLTPPLLSSPPRRGQHTRELLARLGFDQGVVDDLIRQGVASEPPEVGPTSH